MIICMARKYNVKVGRKNGSPSLAGLGESARGRGRRAGKWCVNVLALWRGERPSSHRTRGRRFAGDVGRERAVGLVLELGRLRIERPVAVGRRVVAVPVWRLSRDKRGDMKTQPWESAVQKEEHNTHEGYRQR